jgi:4-amino-4-deoxy-L-arabinose transferase-like glycosyltransferase
LAQAVTGDVIAPSDSPRVARSIPMRVWLAVIIGLAILLRLLWVLHAARPTKALNDPYFYTVFADRISQGRGYTLISGEPTAFYPVGYPGFLAGVFWLVHQAHTPDNLARLIGLSQLILGVATVALVFEVARRLYDTSTGLVAAAVVALWPNLIFHTATALSETLFNFLAMCAVLVIVWRPWARLKTGQVVLFGALVGVSALVRPISLLFVPVLLFAGRRAGFAWRPSLRRVLVVTVVAGAIIAPWTIRNIVHMKYPVLISTNLGEDLCMSRHPHATGGFTLDDYCYHGFDRYKRPEYEIRKDHGASGRAISYLVHHPLDEPRLVLWRVYFTLHHDRDGLEASESYGNYRYLGSDERNLLGTVADSYFFAALGLGVLGLWRVRSRQDARRLFVVLAMAALAAPPLVFFGDPRFHVPAVPLFAIPVALSLLAVGRRVTVRGSKASAAVA